MTDSPSPTPDDLVGTADERRAQLAALTVPLPADWLHRQLIAALNAWAGDETTLDIGIEARTDY
ncbi:hypothetical protein LQ938_11815 [Microbacterium sp. cx-55]|uniref:hypothetical protein n=1 Tax=Microbacterium sp. cx-55 TaxID=2875948 RepID=UPI001CBFDB19|nr:hypothetical protein [Microbacterium sp. cx-55]MBZ4488041.1 hypothetical protein [Microbacterium sp. cx-55]UGB34553.1 hypothetical protein LQ938_11815 [Microbacterium sp. cx-55]